MITAATTDGECIRILDTGTDAAKAMALAELVKRGLRMSAAQHRENEKNKRAIRRDSLVLGGW